MQIGVWDLGAAIAKALLYAATLCAAGMALFSLYAPLGETPRRVLEREIRWLAFAALLLSALKFPLLGAALGGLESALDPRILERSLTGPEGMSALLRAAGLILLCLPRWPLTMAGVLCTAVSFTLTGHVHARHSGAPSALLTLHAFCAALWLGALAPLARALQATPALAALQVARFSTQALLAVPLLLLAGGVLLVQLLGSLTALVGTAYGRLLCAKLTLVAGLLALAAWNRWRLTPRLDTAEGRRALLFSIRAEMGLAAGVLAVTAALTSFAGPER